MAARFLGALLLFACAPAFCQTDDLAVGKLSGGQPRSGRSKLRQDRHPAGALRRRERRGRPGDQQAHRRSHFARLPRSEGSQRPQGPGLHRRPRGVEQRAGVAEVRQKTRGRGPRFRRRVPDQQQGSADEDPGLQRRGHRVSHLHRLRGLASRATGARSGAGRLAHHAGRRGRPCFTPIPIRCGRA